jgi:anti-sigma factor (TIGR02949 family)
MSCGNPHETDCGEVLDHLYEYLDNEMGEGDCAKLRQHFDECSPCLEKYGLEQAIKALIKRSCGCDATPSDLRSKVLARIDSIRTGERSAEAALVAERGTAGGGRTIGHDAVAYAVADPVTSD